MVLDSGWVSQGKQLEAAWDWAALNVSKFALVGVMMWPVWHMQLGWCLAPKFLASIFGNKRETLGLGRSRAFLKV